MRRNLAFVALGAAALWLAVVGEKMIGPGTAAAAKSDSRTPPGLGLKVAGGWFFDIEVPPGNPAGKRFLMLTADGGVTLADTTRPDGRLDTIGVGSWRALGPGMVTMTFLLSIQEHDGSTWAYEKVHLELALSDDGSVLEGEGPIGIYGPDQDPLDPEEVPLFGIPIWCRGRRILPD